MPSVPFIHLCKLARGTCKGSARVPTGRRLSRPNRRRGRWSPTRRPRRKATHRPSFVVVPGPPDLAVFPEFAVFLLALEDVDDVNRLIVLVPVNQDAEVTDPELVPRVVLQPIEEVVRKVAAIMHISCQLRI